MNENKFDPGKLQKLNDPQRLADIPPGYVWGKLNIEKPRVIVDIGAGTGFSVLHSFKNPDLLKSMPVIYHT